MAAEQPKIQAIFNEAIARDSDEERSQYLAEACGDDAQLRTRVDALLLAHSEAGGFFGGQPPATEFRPISEQPGSQIGPYKLLQQIGEGGMGTVFMADQAEPVQRRVALKIIKPGMDTQQVVARFEAERQALAMMDHPNIAKVLDAGTTDSGRPYFVMELIKGVPVTQYCDDQHLTPRERLELFVPICQAVQHAHQKGIIHRDIKPTNILVAQFDDKPIPKVIDFGVAKATSQKLTEKSMFTAFGQIVGTLEYMSPEQAQFNQLDVDTRSDVYSLGVLLYELLTGETPFDKKRLRSAAFEELLRIIREEEPPRPSTKLSSSESLPNTAVNRNTEPRKLSLLVRGELDWIVMKALEKDRTRRYETASGFAADIQRFLNDEPIVACPTSKWYRASKYVRKHRSKILVATLVFLSILLSAGAIGWSARDRQTRATQAAVRIDHHLQDVDRLISEEKWSESLASAHLAEEASGVTDPERRQQIQDAIEFLNFMLQLDANRAVPFDTVNSRFNFAKVDQAYSRIFLDYGIDFESAPSKETIQKLQSTGAGVPLAGCLDHWIFVRHRMKRNEETLITVASALDSDAFRNELRLLFGRPVNEEVRNKLISLAEMDQLHQHPLSTLYVLSYALRSADLADQAVSVLQIAQKGWPDDFAVNVALGNALGAQKRPQEAIRYYSTANGLRPNDFVVLGNLSVALIQTKRFEEAAAYCRRGLEIDSKYDLLHRQLGNALLGLGKPEEAKQHMQQAINLNPKSASAHHGLGRVYQILGQPDKELFYYRQADELDPQNPIFLACMGAAFFDQEKIPDAIEAFRESIEIDPSFAYSYVHLGPCLQKQDQLQEAITAYRQAIELDPEEAVAHYRLGNMLGEMGKPHVAMTHYQLAVVLDPEDPTAFLNLGVGLSDLKQYEAAAAAARKAIELEPKSRIKKLSDKALAAAYNNLAHALLMLKQYDEAEEHYNKAIELDPLKAQYFSNLGKGLRAQRKLQEAIAAQQKAIQLDPSYANAHNQLGILFLDQKQFGEAIQSFRVALDLDPNQAHVHNNIGIVLGEQRKHKEARDAYRKAIELGNEDADTHRNLAKTLLLIGQDDLAADHFLKAIDLDHPGAFGEFSAFLFQKQEFVGSSAFLRRALELDPNDALAHHNLGVALERQKKFDEAYQSFKRAVELNPNDHQSRFRLASSLLQQSKLEESITHLQLVLDTADPESDEEIIKRAHHEFGRVRFQQGQLDEAIACWKKTLEIDPDHSPAHCRLGEVWFNQNKLDLAIESLRSAIAIDPNLASAHQFLAAALLKQGDQAAAIKHLRHAVSLNPSDEWSLKNLASLLNKQGDVLGVIDYCRKILAIEPENIEVLLLLANKLVRLNTKEAFGIYRKLLAIEPDNAATNNDLAWHLATTTKTRLRNPKEAVEFAEQAVKLKPESWSYWDTLSVASYRSGNWARALEARQKKIQFKSQTPSDGIWLAMIYWQLDQKEKARQQYTEAANKIYKMPSPNSGLKSLCWEAEELLKIRPIVITEKAKENQEIKDVTVASERK